MDRIGIMLDWALMEKGIQGLKSYERLPYYVEIGRELGLEPVFFHPRHVKPGDERVKGYFWNGNRLVSQLVSVPRVIHNRVLTGDTKARNVIRRLSQKKTVFNGLVVRDKRRVHQMLWKNEHIRSYLPHTVPYSMEQLRQFLDKYQVVYVKPSIGSVGIGVARIERHGGNYHFIASKKRQILSHSQILSTVRRWVGNKRFLIQRGIPLARYAGKTFDIRVSVQKNKEKQWTVSGMVAKVANQKNKLSNLSRGGTAVPFSEALVPIFPEVKQQQAVIERVGIAAVEIAKQYGRHFSSLADLGMDMGIDERGNPYLIEVNVRDQRYSFFKAGEKAMFKQTYRHPLEYAQTLLAEKKNRKHQLLSPSYLL
ncbi:YheC/YheD family protein [Brevibacillus sp. HB1.2]|uniref:YheC/YheD family endospore coat-associated protein n=1 Tax=unclassified Brevibacillus TaxID=2684853 RepID=UPI00156B8F40|nr:YheC/YheD family protein [Brevibacillus sp. HB1.4B]NTU19665.1 YheC/YheD family protein [Brevibacillus sp. HB1.2]NTU28917.1 YheC/YheD family protein [Brevibacillus sp. HB1.1]